MRGLLSLLLLFSFLFFFKIAGMFRGAMGTQFTGVGWFMDN